MRGGGVGGGGSSKQASKQVELGLEGEAKETGRNKMGGRFCWEASKCPLRGFTGNMGFQSWVYVCGTGRGEHTTDPRITSVTRCAHTGSLAPARRYMIKR